MPAPQELEAKFWKLLEKDRTVMLGLDGANESHLRPMTAQFETKGGPIYFFSAKDTELVKALSSGSGLLWRLHRRTTICLQGSTVGSHWTTTQIPSTGCGIVSWLPGTKGAKPTRS